MLIKQTALLLAASLALAGCVELDSRAPENQTPPETVDPAPEEPAPEEPAPEEPAAPQTATPYAEGATLSSFHLVVQGGFPTPFRIERTLSGNFLYRNSFAAPSPGFWQPYPLGITEVFVSTDSGFKREDVAAQLLDTANYQLSWSSNNVIFDIFHEAVDVTGLSVRDFLVDQGLSVDAEAFVDGKVLFTSGATAYLETLTYSSDLVLYPHVDESFAGQPDPCGFPSGDRFALYGTCNYITYNPSAAYAPATDLGTLTGADLASAPRIQDIFRLNSSFDYKLVETAPGSGTLHEAPIGSGSFTEIGTWSAETLSDGTSYIDLGPSSIVYAVYTKEYADLFSEKFLANNTRAALFVADGYVRTGYIAPAGTDAVSGLPIFNDTALQDISDSIMAP